MSVSEQVIDRTEKVDTGKLFWVKERQIYADWTLAMWRELFQNSVDAGAKRIDVSVASMDRRGSFGHSPQDGQVTRLVFQDNGPGMDEDVLRHVFFRPGETTKKDDTTVGGFGRARLLTCYSQVRFSIHTQDKVVEGDGSSYNIYTKPAAIDAFERWAVSADQRDTPADVASAALLRAEATRLADGPDRLKGCRFEIDVDPSEGDRYGRKATADGMRSRLFEYLRQSDVPCVVTIDGEEYTKPKIKVEGRRDLVATLAEDEVPQAWHDNPKVKVDRRPDGRFDVVFGRLAQISEDTPESNSGELVVRVSGASMYTKHTSLKTACFLEVNPALAREVLTANRDAMKTSFQRSVDDLLKLMATDAKAALQKDTGTSFRYVRGGRGAKRAELPESEDHDLDLQATARRGGSPTLAILRRIENESTFISFDDWDWERFATGKVDNIDTDGFKRFFEHLKTADVAQTFLGKFSDKNAALALQSNVRSGNYARAMKEASGYLLGFIADSLKLVQVDKELRELERNRVKLSDLNDVPILYDNVNPPRDEFQDEAYRRRRTSIRKAASRYDPLNWDVSEGKGIKPRKTLAAWSVAIDRVVAMLMKTYPNDVKPFTYASGWVFSHPQKTYTQLGSRREWIDTRAMARPEVNGDEKSFQFLLNPLDSRNDFKSLYSPTDPDDMDVIIGLAAHEVAHVTAENHSDAFSEVHTRLSLLLTTKVRRDIHAGMRAAMKAVDVVYASGRTRVAPMDDEPGERPFERLASGMDPELAGRLSSDGDGAFSYDPEAPAPEDDEPDDACAFRA